MKRILIATLLITTLVTSCASQSSTSSTTLTDNQLPVESDTLTTASPNQLVTPTQSKTFQNPISTGNAPDPFVTYHDGYYYCLYTEATKISIYRHVSLDKVLKGKPKQVYSAGKEVVSDIWAPELHFNPKTNKWYIYASGATVMNDFSTIRMFCLESETDDPMSKYTFKAFTDPNIMAIDQTVYYDEETKQLYTAYSHFNEKGQVIEFAHMSNPWTIDAQRIELSYPQYDWEKGGWGNVNEGPIFLRHDDKLVLIYSGSGCWSEFYCLGMLEYTGRDFTLKSMLNAANWKKHTNSIFSSANEVYGVGHCSFFNSPDGTETWIAYHGMHTPDAGEGGRYMYVQKIRFDKNDLPILGAPHSRSTKLTLPSEDGQ